MLGEGGLMVAKGGGVRSAHVIAKEGTRMMGRAEHLPQ